MIVHWNQLRPEMVLALSSDVSTDITVVVFPVGAPEAIGEGLPLGLRYLESAKVMEDLVASLQIKLPNWNFVMMPVLPISVDAVSSIVSLSVRPHVVRDALVDQVDQLKRLGFKNFAAIATQVTPKQLSAIEDASKMVSRGGAQMVSLSSMWVDSKSVWNSPMVGVPAEQGGFFDVSFAKKYLNSFIAQEVSQMKMQPPPRSSPKRLWAYFTHQLNEYWGDPSSAFLPDSEKRFEVLWNDRIEKTALAYQAFLESGKGSRIFKSGYKYFFMNGSFFKAYLIAALFFILMVVWTLWSLRGVFEP